jgi:hypothetical protein
VKKSIDAGAPVTDRPGAISLPLEHDLKGHEVGAGDILHEDLPTRFAEHLQVVGVCGSALSGVAVLHLRDVLGNDSPLGIDRFGVSVRGLFPDDFKPQLLGLKNLLPPLKHGEGVCGIRTEGFKYPLASPVRVA